MRHFCTSSASAAPGAATRAGGAASEALAESARANAGIRGFLDAGDGAGATQTGRAWRTHELRLKSFEDLHRLWFVLVRERNVLLTEKEWCRSNGRHWLRGESNLYKLKRSMARLKGVVGERSRAYKAHKALAKAAEKATSGGLAPATSVSAPKAGVTTRL
jgi:hypothetical protein